MSDYKWDVIGFCFLVTLLFSVAIFGTVQQWQHIGWLWGLAIIVLLLASPKRPDEKGDKNE